MARIKLTKNATVEVQAYDAISDVSGDLEIT